MRCIRSVGILLLVGSVLVADACSSPSYPTATVACCKDAIETRQQIVPVLRRKCPHATGRVTLDLAQSGLRRTFECSTILESEAAAEGALASSVANQNDAASRAASMIRFWRELGVRAEDTEAGLTWMLAIMKSNFGCVRADALSFRRDEIAEAKVAGENAEHWLRVEAGWIAGACPDRLDALFKTVIAAGQPDAVRTVRAAFAALSQSQGGSGNTAARRPLPEAPTSAVFGSHFA